MIVGSGASSSDDEGYDIKLVRRITISTWDILVSSSSKLARAPPRSHSESVDSMRFFDCRNHSYRFHPSPTLSVAIRY